GGRTLVDAYPDRFLLGIGVSHAPIVRLRGRTYERPVERMREYLDAMDAAPLVAPTRDPAPRVLAALGPRMLRLAAERSLGAHPYFVPVQHTKIARHERARGPRVAALAGRRARSCGGRPAPRRRPSPRAARPD